MTDSATLARNREEIAREIKQIFAHIKLHPEDTGTLNRAAKSLRSKSESGYRGLVRLLDKYGYLHLLLQTNNQSGIEDQTDDGGKNGTTNNPDLVAFNQDQASSKNGNSRSIIFPGGGGSNNPSGPSNVISQSVPQASAASETSPSTSGLIPNEVVQNPQENRRSSVRKTEQQRSERYARTKYFLSKTGLLSITNKTADLLKQNKQVQNDLDSLKQQTDEFVQSVLRNPANQTLMNKNNPTLNSAVNIDTTASETDNSEFANILSGIYDFELPSVILAPLNVEQVLMPDTEDQLSLEQINAIQNPSQPSTPPSKRPKLD